MGMTTSLLARGGVPVKLDRERIVLFNMQSTGLIMRKYGMTFWRELFVSASAEEGKAGTAVVKDIEALQYFLWAGLQADAQSHRETLTLDQVADLIVPMTVPPIAAALMMALTFQFNAPAPEGKAEAVAASPADAASNGAGNRKASTTPVPRRSRSASSTGRRSSSSKRPSRK